MLHKRGYWSVTPVSNPEELATKLTEHTWTLCTGFSLGGYLFLNDSTSEDGAQEYAVVKPLRDGGFVQVESITFGWCTKGRAFELIRKTLRGEYDAEAAFGRVKPNLEPPEGHRCPYCA